MAPTPKPRLFVSTNDWFQLPHSIHKKKTNFPGQDRVRSPERRRPDPLPHTDRLHLPTNPAGTQHTGAGLTTEADRPAQNSPDRNPDPAAKAPHTELTEPHECHRSSRQHCPTATGPIQR